MLFLSFPCRRVEDGKLKLPELEPCETRSLVEKNPRGEKLRKVASKSQSRVGVSKRSR